MKDIVKRYTNGEVTVVWKPELCIHSAVCVGGLPQVFHPKELPVDHARARDDRRDHAAGGSMPVGRAVVGEGSAPELKRGFTSARQCGYGEPFSDRSVGREASCR